jgi:hypothetical protein
MIARSAMNVSRTKIKMLARPIQVARSALDLMDKHGGHAHLHNSSVCAKDPNLHLPQLDQ